jgi:putative restriction endonuclease
MPRTVVTNSEEIAENIAYVADALGSDDGRTIEIAKDLIRRGFSFVVQPDDTGQLWFGPSRFVGYRGNNFAEHDNDRKKHGDVTSRAIRLVIGDEGEDETLEQKFRAFCVRVGVKPQEKRRRFWRPLPAAPRTRRADSSDRSAT